jgi:antitoxin PrlF
MPGAVQEATITSKGQVTIPKAVRERMGLRPGDRIRFVSDRHGYRMQKPAPKESPFAKWRGYAKEFEGQDPDKLIDEMRGR